MNFSGFTNGWATDPQYADFGNPLSSLLFADGNQNLPLGNPLDPNLGRTEGPVTPPPADVPTNDVVVTARKQPVEVTPSQVQEPPAPPPVRRPISILPPDGRSQEEYDNANKGIQAKRPGFLQRVLGFIGDAYSVGQGNRPMFRDRQDALKMGAAEFGANKSPQEMNNAIERLRALGYVDQADKLSQQAQEMQYKQAAQESLINQRAAMTADRQYKMRQDLGNYAARLIQAAKTPEQLEYVKDVIAARAGQADINLSDIFPEGLSSITMDNKDLIGAGDMSVYQSQQLPIQQARLANDTERVGIAKGQLGVAQQNAESNRIRANRPPAGRAAPQPTNASMAQPIMDMIGKVGWDKLPKPLQDKARALGYDPDRGKKGRRGPPPLPPGFSLK